MKRLFPQPLISVMLFVVWLALNNTLHPAHVLLGALLAVVIPWWTSTFAGGIKAPSVKQPLTIVILGLIVVFDIVKSNIAVARLIMGRQSNINPAFVWVPLDITDAHAKAVLAGIITMTPGTVSADFSEDGKYLLVHALNVTDVGQLIAEIKSRYELPLKEIFE